ncbi:hypothetical protein [Wolbachia endosymbiont of Ctenocephalides felis wCfeT]|uniref:hypothetical protein n=1 Tax=Wolbachia endosymbiont of Ctenocephalides felis wCfeT TaxID=2732593 RepID=UPI0014471FB9|nr:hypothetical protein [Wolbachia endosymbiont of Ctenocephalides felis wCfeT]
MTNVVENLSSGPSENGSPEKFKTGMTWPDGSINLLYKPKAPHPSQTSGPIRASLSEIENRSLGTGESSDDELTNTDVDETPGKKSRSGSEGFKTPDNTPTKPNFQDIPRSTSSKSSVVKNLFDTSSIATSSITPPSSGSDYNSEAGSQTPLIIKANPESDSKVGLQTPVISSNRIWPRIKYALQVSIQVYGLRSNSQ